MPSGRWQREGRMSWLVMLGGLLSFEGVKNIIAKYMANKALDIVYSKVKNKYSGNKKALHKAIDYADRKFSEKYPKLSVSLFDRHFIYSTAIKQLELLLTGQIPDPKVIADDYRRQFKILKLSDVDIIEAAEDLIKFVVNGMKMEKLHEWVNHYYDEVNRSSMQKINDRLDTLGLEITESFYSLAKKAAIQQPVVIVYIKDDEDIAIWLQEQVKILRLPCVVDRIDECSPSLNIKIYLSDLSDCSNTVYLLFSEKMLNKYFNINNATLRSLYAEWFENDNGPLNIWPLIIELLPPSPPAPKRYIDVFLDREARDDNAIFKKLAVSLNTSFHSGLSVPCPPPRTRSPIAELAEQKQKRSHGEPQ